MADRDPAEPVDPAYDSFADFYLHSDYGAFVQRHRSGGTFGLGMIEVEQGAIETVDPATDETVIVSTKTLSSAEYDFGDGWRTARITPHTVDIQPAHQACGIRAPELGLQLVTVKAHTLAELLDEVGARPDALDAVTGRFGEMPRASALVEELWGAMNRPGAFSTLLMDGIFMRLVGELLESAGQGCADEGSSGRSAKADEPRFRRVIEYVEANLEGELTIGELAEVAGMKRASFARAFRTAYGEAVWTYVEKRRAALALELLRRSRLPLEAVARRCGFASAGHLSVVLRRQFGMTVEAVRRG